MIGARALTVLISLFCVVSVVSAAESDSYTYLHRSRGGDLRAVKMKVTTKADRTVQYKIGDFPGGGDESTVELTLDGKGKPVEYVSKSNKAGGYEMEFAFEPTSVALRRKLPDKPEEKNECPVRAGSLPELNSRPDPYLTEHLLIRAYDFAKGGKQTFDVYDVDDKGTGLVEYQTSLELADEDGVALPNGKFKARHLVQLQQSSAPTWYKKHRGSQTDVWVNNEGAILRIYRHREPYELILQDYDKKADLISKSETAQGCAQPPVKAP